MKSNKKVTITVLCLVIILQLSATIINIPEDHPTIQIGIDVATEGDTILVQPGTYYENINYSGQNIVVGSLYLTTQISSYIEQTVIDGNNSGNVVKFKNGESSSAILCGFTITNGLAELYWNYNYGGGIICANSDPTITDCIISENNASPVGKGGGVFCGASNATFRNVSILDNYATDTGGGIQVNSDAHIILENVIIRDNVANWGGGIFIYGGSNPYLSYVEITNNTAYTEGGGILCYVGCDPVFHNLTVSGNYSPTGAGIFVGINCNPVAVNSICWNNNPSEIFLSNGSIDITYSDIQGGWNGLGNINADPLFNDVLNNDFHLTEASPCIDAGDPASPLDPDETRADMGAYYYEYGYLLYADFEGSPVSGNVPLNVHFTNLSVGDIVEWEWDFNNDGITDSYLQNPTYIYNEAGVYSVSLTVSDTTDENTEIKTDYISVLDSLNADFEGSPNCGEFPLEVQFTDLSTGSVQGYMWDFNNDGFIDSNQQNPLFIFEQTGVYDVSLIITDGSNEDMEIKFEYITVSDTTSSNNIPFPLNTSLQQNFPNPFNPTTTIEFSLGFDVIKFAEVAIFNLKGQKVREFNISKDQELIKWNGKDENGLDVSSGVYLYELKVNNRIMGMRKMLLLK